MSTLPDLEALAVFARVAELRSFTAAAAALGLSKATVSKAVARLERRIGARLLNRTAHRLALTEAGRRLRERAAQMLLEAEAAEAECLAEATTPRGQVRLAAPMSFGLLEVAPRLPEFLARHPEVTVDLHLSDARVDLIGEGFDAALRIGALRDSALLARRLRPVEMRLVAAPAYLEARGRPARPAEIARMDWLGYAYSQSSILEFTAPEAAAVSLPPPRLRATSGEALIPALLAGLGVAVLPTFIIAEPLAAGALEPVLPAWSLPSSALHLLTPPGGPRPPRVTALLDFLAAALARS